MPFDDADIEVVASTRHEASIAAAEQLRELNYKTWDDTDDTCERILDWLRGSDDGVD